MGTWRHVKAFVLEPFLGFFVVPALIMLFVSEPNIGWGMASPFHILPTFAGCILICLGLFLLLRTSHLFAKHGKGTVAHWDPPDELVIAGIYRHVRNPLMWGMVITILGEAVLLGVRSLLIYMLALWILNHILFVKVEEPYLIRKYGDDYRRYMEHVPRWLPRLTPWTGPSEKDAEIDQDTTAE